MLRIRPLVSITLLGLFLSGCSSLQSSRPLAGSDRTLPVSCTQVYPGTRLQQIRAISTALEHEGYEVRTTDVELGLVSAERIRRQPGLGATEQWQSSSWAGAMRGGMRVGYGLANPFNVFRADPHSVERVSVSAERDRYTAVRSMTVLSPEGYTIDARVASPEPFCRQIHEAIHHAIADQGATS